MATTPMRNETALVKDWFIPAIETNGSVGRCLDAVLEELGQRQAFVLALKANLAGPSSSTGIDTISELSLRLRALENTLHLRLGILRPERPAAWFRAPAVTTSGPFSSALIAEPVFGRYEAREAAKVRQNLIDSFENKRVELLPFLDQGTSLWRTLLELNAAFEKCMQLPSPFTGLRFDTLPNGLPETLASRPLEAFLINVRNEALATRERLYNAFAQLKDASEKLWNHQIAEELKRQRTAEASGRRSQAGATADELRAEFARQRQRAQTRIPLKDLEALRFMGFEDYPSPAVLRQRYLEMAKRLHPDRLGGNEQSFKTLTRVYEQLSQRTTSTSTSPASEI